MSHWIQKKVSFKVEKNIANEPIFDHADFQNLLKHEKKVVII